ncbi:hypothetical protein GFD17_09960 [Bifidobacterium sp. SMB2]|uniref:Uncharacterized protein n=1 Tax=Bifidobacterium saimiriisciurei TaxID=2661627 RepID=A0ABX0CHI9_9BIFI|nr:MULTISPECIES: hypothetical protein [Bifidobacterium]NEG97071.1 hypothetical protein [Bifidobacterium sp. SMB2]NEH12153.1 hypothetical protein [Bifidobacterium saimiriisciurei]
MDDMRMKAKGTVLVVGGTGAGDDGAGAGDDGVNVGGAGPIGAGPPAMGAGSSVLPMPLPDGVRSLPLPRPKRFYTRAGGGIGVDGNRGAGGHRAGNGSRRADGEYDGKSRAMNRLRRNGPIGAASQIGAGLSSANARGGAVLFFSPTGGAGVSVLAAMCSWSLTQRDRSCALVDLDLAAGGLDVLLGQEAEEGLRWSGISAPLGRIEPEALINELPKWDDVVVLAADPWNGGEPDWWEVEAALSALAENRDVLVFDAGHAVAWKDMPVAVRVMLVELSVLGLARARGMLRWLHGGGADAVDGVAVDSGGGILHGDADAEGTTTILVGIRPPVSSRAGAVSKREAEDYLKTSMIGVMKRDAALGKSILSGFGIARIPRKYRKLMNELCDRIEEACRHDRRHDR